VTNPRTESGSDVAHGAEIAPLSDHEFGLFQRWIHREAGIFLTDAKRALLTSRLAPRLRALGLASFGRYYRYVLEHLPDEGITLLDCVTTNETHFFREPRQFDWLERDVLPRWKAAMARGERPRSIRVWSAACSTGEEPYSIAMSLLDAFGSSGDVEIEILATDLSTRALQRAEAAIWSVDRVREIPPRYCKRFMLRGVGRREGTICAGTQIHSLVRFGRLNLHAEPWPVRGGFDLVLCRNALIYFGADARRRVIGRLLDHVAPGGYLLLGQAETLQASMHPIRVVAPSAYERVGPSRGPTTNADRDDDAGKS
jgi:chemotaxis protein methyltransferase CheR